MGTYSEINLLKDDNLYKGRNWIFLIVIRRISTNDKDKFQLKNFVISFMNYNTIKTKFRE